MPGLFPNPLYLTKTKRNELEKLVKKHSTPQQIALRARIIMLADEGKNHRQIARELKISRDTARHWRRRWKQIRNLNTLEYLDKAINIIFVGPPGIGKSHLSISLAIKACEKRKRIMFYTVQELVDDLAKAKLIGHLGRELSKLGRIDLLVWDELGYMDLTKDSATLFFQLVSRRYERGSITLNTNRPFEE